MIDKHQESSGNELQLLSIVETAALLGCSRANVYALVNAGELPVISIGKSRGYRIDRRDIEEFLQRRKFCKEGRQPAPPSPRPRLKHIKL